GLTFTPGAAGTRSATLSLTDNTVAATHTVTLSGKGTTPPSVPAPAPVPPPAVTSPPSPVLQAPPIARSSDLAVTGLRVARRIRIGQARRRGITARFSAPASAAV